MLFLLAVLQRWFEVGPGMGCARSKWSGLCVCGK